VLIYQITRVSDVTRHIGSRFSTTCRADTRSHRSVGNNSGPYGCTDLTIGVQASEIARLGLRQPRRPDAIFIEQPLWRGTSDLTGPRSPVGHPQLPSQI
jgi:hypothetical protein